MKKTAFSDGLSFFIIHFLTETICFFILADYMGWATRALICLLYDFLAFVPQGIFGLIADENRKDSFTIYGAALTLISVAMHFMSLNAFAVIVVLSTGNAMIHVSGAQTTLRNSDGKMTPAALFVGGGSFGVVTGKILGVNMSQHRLSTHIFLAVMGIMIILIYRLFVSGADFADNSNLRKYSFDNKNISTGLFVVTVGFVVVVRAYIGYGIPTSWNKTVPQTVLLYVTMGIGKCLGGVLTDAIGIKKTALISTLGAIPFLVFGDRVMVISVIGVMMFSMTMAVCLGLLVSRLNEYPGVAFGVTTLGLFLGTLPVFIFRISSVFINCILISVLSVVCAVILTKVSE